MDPFYSTNSLSPQKHPFFTSYPSFLTSFPPLIFSIDYPFCAVTQSSAIDHRPTPSLFVPPIHSYLPLTSSLPFILSFWCSSMLHFCHSLLPLPSTTSGDIHLSFNLPFQPIIYHSTTHQLLLCPTFTSYPISNHLSLLHLHFATPSTFILCHHTLLYSPHGALRVCSNTFIYPVLPQIFSPALI